MAAKGVTCPFQLRFDLPKIVNFTVEDKDVSTVAGLHWLMAFGAQILNGKPAMSQAYAAGRVRPDAVIIRAAMTQGRRHFQRERLQLGAGQPSRGINKSSNTTHKNELVGLS